MRNALIRNLLFGLSFFLVLASSADTFKYSCLNPYVGPGKYGERYFLDSTIKSDLSLFEQIKSLKIMSQNFENLGEFAEHRVITIDDHGTSVKKEINFTMVKSENQKLRLARRISDENPDIIVATEVKDIETAQEYSKKYLDDKYQAVLIEGNDGRGIDVCFFIKRTLNLDFEVESHKTYPSTSNPGTPIFSRDFPVLKIRAPGAPKDSTPLMAVFGTHLKSQLGSEGPVDKTAKKRAEQVLASLEILKQFEKDYPGIPYIVAGDQNADVQKAPEFAPYFQNGLEDTMNVAKDSPPPDQRFTEFYLPEGSTDHLVKKSQLDLILTNLAMKGFVVSSTIKRDVLATGEAVPLPETANQINRRASDHDGLVLILDFFSLLKQRFFPN